jgi:nitrile hydratase subunit alpha
MPFESNQTMGRVLARAWSDSAFKTRLLAEPRAALAELDIELPDTPLLVARENTAKTIHLVISAPPIALPTSALSEIRDFAEVYRDPRLWPLNWIGRDPPASARLMADPRAELARLGVRAPKSLRVIILANTAAVTHLILPPRPAERHCTARLFERLSAGYAPAALRLGHLLGKGPYDTLVARLSGEEEP